MCIRDSLIRVQIRAFGKVPFESYGGKPTSVLLLYTTLIISVSIRNRAVSYTHLLVASLNKYGRVEPHYMASLTGTTVEGILGELKGRILSLIHI